jgi:cytochrome c556
MFPTRLLAFATVGLLALFVGHGLAQPKKPAAEPPPSFEKELMEKKRQSAHAILDALTAGDHDALKREATALVRLAERPIFLTDGKGAQPKNKTEEYQFQVKKFKHAADDLLTAAEAKNLDGAALAYSDLTRTCIKCHTHFRGVGIKKD